ncbi:GM20269 [Drosophila sechellia]|uniref:GM20269 n=1 Tax=Drosophila sechellia TaxID=7238 RepID=B4HQK4_DROSE|nr:GM20269 [Drosophila sechellia]
MNPQDMQRAREMANGDASTPGSSPAPLRKALPISLLEKRTQFRYKQVAKTMKSSSSITVNPVPMTTPSAAQTVPKATQCNGSYHDDHDNQLLHVNSVRQGQGGTAASSAPGPGLNNGTASDDLQMRMWW